MQPGKLSSTPATKAGSGAGSGSTAGKSQCCHEAQLSACSNKIAASGSEALHAAAQGRNAQPALAEQAESALHVSIQAFRAGATTAPPTGDSALAPLPVDQVGTVCAPEITALAPASRLAALQQQARRSTPPTPPRSPHQQQPRASASASARKTSDTFHIPVHWPSGCAVAPLTAPAVPAHMWQQSRAVTPMDCELGVAVDETFDPDKGRRTTGFTDMWTRAFANQNGSWHGYADETKKPRSRGLPGWASTELDSDKPASR